MKQIKLIRMREEKYMKKTAAVLAAAMALTISVYASPKTEFAKGLW